MPDQVRHDGKTVHPGSGSRAGIAIPANPGSSPRQATIQRKPRHSGAGHNPAQAPSFRRTLDRVQGRAQESSVMVMERRHTSSFRRTPESSVVVALHYSSLFFVFRRWTLDCLSLTHHSSPITVFWLPTMFSTQRTQRTHYPSPITGYCLSSSPPSLNSLPRSGREDHKTSLSLDEGRGWSLPRTPIRGEGE